MSFLTTDIYNATAPEIVNPTSSPAPDGSHAVDFRSIVLISSAVILVLSVFSGILGNVLVCVSVYSNRSLRNANNALLVNLAVADLVVCFTSIPFMLAEVSNIYGGEPCPSFGDIVCPVQTFFHVASSSVQLTTLVAVSLERYEAIVRPFETKKKRRRVVIGTTVSWLLALTIATPAAVVFKGSSLYLLCTCQLDAEPVDYVHTAIIAPLGFACLFCVVVFYLRIFRTVRKHVKDKHKGRKETAPLTSTTRKTLRDACRSLNCCRTNVVGIAPVDLVLPNEGTVPPVQSIGDKPSGSGVRSLRQHDGNSGMIEGNGAETNVGGSLAPKHRGDGTAWTSVEEPAGRSITPDTGVGSSGIPQEQNDREQSGIERQMLDTEGLQPGGLLVAVIPATPTSFSRADETDGLTPATSTLKESSRPADGIQRSTNDDIQGSVCVLNPAMRVRGRRNLEAKTAKRASYIIGVFSLCWLPLFVVSYLDTSIEVNILVTCVAAMSASLNPIVYTVVNKSFRTEFVKALRKLTICCPGKCKR